MQELTEKIVDIVERYKVDLIPSRHQLPSCPKKRKDDANADGDSDGEEDYDDEVILPNYLLSMVLYVA